MKKQNDGIHLLSLRTLLNWAALFH